MGLDLDFAYAQARIQGRFSRLPAEDEWQRLAASRTLASFLEEARLGSLRNWIKGFSGQSDVHDLEAGLRSLHRDALEELCGWVPVPWRDALSWTRWLVHLPLLAHLGAGRPMPGWVARDLELRGLLGEDGALDPRRLSNAGLDVLMHAEQGPASAWILQWRRRWPRCGRETSRNLEALTAPLAGQVEGFGRISPTATRALRKELRERLRLSLHRNTLQPSVPFVYLALMSLDLERLRAALVSRALFSPQGEPAARGQAAA
jgi:hypothetical protein